MFSLRKPSDERFAEFLEAIGDAEYNYGEVGESQNDVPPRRYRAVQVEVTLGESEAVWLRAVAAIQAWKMFAVKGLEIKTSGSVEASADIAMRVRAYGMWALQATRVVFTVNENHRDSSTYGFAHGTLEPHVLAGEELFMVRWDRKSGQVLYTVDAFSRVRPPLSFGLTSRVRKVQRGFRRGSIRAMMQAVAEAAPTSAAASSTA